MKNANERSTADGNAALEFVRSCSARQFADEGDVNLCPDYLAHNVFSPRLGRGECQLCISHHHRLAELLIPHFVQELQE